ncbi:hypothetical protein KC973_00505 [Candidatus Saccharibacteria bacterium]|nr:hypothetical protein [Candidatus Saccharibacteria bacterium]
MSKPTNTDSPKQNVYTSAIKPLFAQLNLIGMLTLVMLVSLLLVLFSYLLYLRSDQSKYDLARPGSNRSRVLDTEDEAVDTTSPVTVEDVSKKLDALDKELRALNGYNTFGPDDLSDQNLGLTARDQPSL